MRIYVRFYAELNDFLSPVRRQTTIQRELAGPTAVKDLIEGLGVPHTEVDLILINGESVNFDRRVADGDHVSVFPVFESIDIGAVTRVRPEPLRELRFVVDGHLGRLAAYLRLAGFDTLYGRDCGDEELAAIASRERRVLLTRDQPLLMRRAITRGYFVRATEPRRQLREVVGRFDLASAAQPFRRCLRCNTLLRPVPKSEVLDRLPPKTRQRYSVFYRCAGCDRIYWQGTHAAALERLLAQAFDARRGA